MGGSSFNFRARSSSVYAAIRWVAVAWAALIVLNGTGIHHRYAAADAADPPITPIHHVHHADQRIAAPLPIEAGIDLSDGQALVRGPLETDLGSPSAISFAQPEWDPNPILRALAGKELPSRAPPVFLSA